MPAPTRNSTASTPFGGSRGSSPAPTPAKINTEGGAIASSFFGDIDLENVESTGDLPVGAYHVKVEAVDTAYSQNGNEQLVLDLRVQSGDFENRRIRDWITKTDRTLWKIRQVIDALQVTPAEASSGGERALLGKECVITVQTSDYNGRSQVGNYRPLDEE